MGQQQLYIHIGTHKTGTSAIQMALEQNSRQLAKENFRWFLMRNLSAQLMRVRQVDMDFIEKAKATLQDEIKLKDGAKSVLVWSSELLSGDPYNGYRNSEPVAATLREVTRGFDVKIIVYLRRQDKFLESLYTQMIHQGESYSFETFRKRFSNDDFNWEKLIASFAKYFGQDKIIVRRYDKSFLPGKDSLIGDFSEIIGSKALIATNRSFISNKGYSSDALKVARILNPVLDHSERRQMRIMLQNSNSKQPFDHYSFWDTEERATFLNGYRGSNGKIAKEYFNETGGFLFPPEDNSEIPVETNQDISLESLAIVLIKALLAQQKKIDESLLMRYSQKMDAIRTKIKNKLRRKK